MIMQRNTTNMLSSMWFVVFLLPYLLSLAQMLKNNKNGNKQDVIHNGTMPKKFLSSFLTKTE